MFNQTEKLPVEVGDRVAVVYKEKVAKARVVEVIEGVAVFVTVEKGGDAIAYDRNDVMLLYRYKQTPLGTGVIPFVIDSASKL